VTSAPSTSVVIASYNHARFVRQAVESALQQPGVMEVSITDDGSTDGTAGVVREIADARVRLNVFPDNRGACVAFNDALHRSTGRYVAVLNSDDYFLQQKIERQQAFLDTHPDIGAVFGLPLFVDEDGTPFQNDRHAFARLFEPANGDRREWLRRFFYRGNCLCHPTVLIRRECYARIGTLDPLLMQLPDLDLWVRLCSAYQIHVLNEPVTAFRILRHERNTSAPSRERLARAAWEQAMVLEHFTRLPPEDLSTILRDEPAEAPARPQLVRLAYAAIRHARPGYAAFGLNLLRATLRQSPEAVSYREYFRAVGDADPYGAEYARKEFQFLRRSRLVRWARRAMNSLRARNRRR
jgi:glycosyltransferase involved in cell wall biosynthesis